jgi:hypothetical protein
MSFSKTQVLKDLTFGNQIAEEERDALRSYFVKTQAWDRIYNGDIDIIYGPKGSGKSALYVLIQDQDGELFDRKVLLIGAENPQVIGAENPQGSPAFKDLQTSPPTTEREFINIWKLYFLSLIAKVLEDFNIKNAESVKLSSILRAHHLLPSRDTTLGSIISSVRRYVTKYLNPESVQGGLKLDAAGNPDFNGKITFVEPSIEQTSNGFISVDELLKEAAKALDSSGYRIWITIDRLDVAFDESSDLEKNALRALFKAYRDIRNYENIRLKIFLRTDIWKRITEEGFREANHLSRDYHLRWNKDALRNLILRRLMNNSGVVDMYNINIDSVLTNSNEQDLLFDRVFPTQVEIGEKQSTTLDWILKRTADGTGESQPRDIILFLNKLCEVQNKKLETGGDEPGDELLFDRTVFKEAMPALSEYRVTRVLFAEYQELRAYIEKMREQKTEQNSESLARLWEINVTDAAKIARQLRDIGFFEERSGGASYWVPFVYRSYLAMVQGKADELIGQGSQIGGSVESVV